MTSELETSLREDVISALKTCYDPEIPVNIYELGLIYDIQIGAEPNVTLRMTLTSPHCPAVATLPLEVQEKVKSIPGVKDCKLDLVWEPPWDPSRMSEAAKLELGMPMD